MVGVKGEFEWNHPVDPGADTDADVTSVSPLTLVAPFLALIRSPLTSGPITSLALNSLNSLLISVLPLYFTPPPTTITPSSPLQLGLAYITATLSQCRFPSSSPQSDELVLLRLLRVIESLCAPMALPSSSSAMHHTLLDHMGDESVCELLEVGLGMLARARLGDGLRNAAQSCVQTLTRRVFVRLKTLGPEQVDELLSAAKRLDKERQARREEKKRLKAEKKAAEKPAEVKQPNGHEGTVPPPNGVVDEPVAQEDEPDSEDDRTSLAFGKCTLLTFHRD